MKRLLPLFLLSLVLGGATARAAEPADPVNGFLTAMSNADSDAMAALYTDDATVFMPFDAVPSRLVGKAQIHEVFEKFFAGVRKSGKPPYMSLNPRDLQTQLFGDTAIITFHLGTPPADDATEPVAFSRRTFVVTKKGDRWLIAHLHASNMKLQPKKKE